jgi:hypothetical protein
MNLRFLKKMCGIGRIQIYLLGCLRGRVVKPVIAYGLRWGYQRVVDTRARRSTFRNF